MRSPGLGEIPLLQPRLDEITQNTRRLVQPERLLVAERLIADLFETDIESRMLPVGAQAPSFSLQDSSSGHMIHSQDLLQIGALVVCFVRGRWDPYCMTELETWRDLYPEVRRRGALLVAVSPQTVRQGDFAVQQHGLPFPLLRDAQCAVAEQFGISYPVSAEMNRYYRSILLSLRFINEGLNPMQSSSGAPVCLPLPATFLIDQRGVIRFSEGHADHRVRPEPGEILRLLP